MFLSNRILNCTRYLLWVSYDGSRFPEMAKSVDSRGVMSFVNTAFRCSCKIDAFSRTDKGVHACRNALCIQVPNEGIGCDKKVLLNSLNKIAVDCIPGGIRFLDIESVSNGFCVRRHALYRKYRYRILITNKEEVLKNTLSLTEFSEANYSWLLPAGFHPYKAKEACELFKVLFSSFWVFLAAIMLHFSNRYTIYVIAKSFLRGQVRRMVSTIVSYSYDRTNLETIASLFLDAKPEKYHWNGFRPAPAGGLYLDDVVYDSRMFMNPVPYVHHLWDAADDSGLSNI
uniref:tRNA pseudouridine synthase n=1 Tax=Syphacia muris TaxID=451379 RepID=A0A0N5AKI7_9BILA